METEWARRDLRQTQRALGHTRIEMTARHYGLDDLAGGLTDRLYRHLPLHRPRGATEVSDGGAEPL